jgi:hypothetical protein
VGENPTGLSSISKSPVITFLLVLLAMNSFNMLNMCHVQFLELLVPPTRGRGQMMLPPAHLGIFFKYVLDISLNRCRHIQVL